jgi:hypothetical protein
MAEQGGNRPADYAKTEWSTTGTKTEIAAPKRAAGFVFEDIPTFDGENWRRNLNGSMHQWSAGAMIRQFDSIAEAIEGGVNPGEVFMWRSSLISGSPGKLPIPLEGSDIIYTDDNAYNIQDIACDGHRIYIATQTDNIIRAYSIDALDEINESTPDWIYDASAATDYGNVSCLYADGKYLHIGYSSGISGFELGRTLTVSDGLLYSTWPAHTGTGSITLMRSDGLVAVRVYASSHIESVTLTPTNHVSLSTYNRTATCNAACIANGYLYFGGIRYGTVDIEKRLLSNLGSVTAQGWQIQLPNSTGIPKIRGLDVDNELLVASVDAYLIDTLSGGNDIPVTVAMLSTEHINSGVNNVIWHGYSQLSGQKANQILMDDKDVYAIGDESIGYYNKFRGAAFRMNTPGKEVSASGIELTNRFVTNGRSLFVAGSDTVIRVYTRNARSKLMYVCDPDDRSRAPFYNIAQPLGCY